MLLDIHSVFKYLALGIILLVTIISYFGWKKQKLYTKANEILTRLNIGIVHSQMLIGIILLTHSSKVSYKSNDLNNSTFLYYSILHPAIMFIAIILVSLSLMYVRNLKLDLQKYKLTFLFNFFALIIILFGVLYRPS